MLFEDVPNPITLRELIRHRVREEVVRSDAKLDWRAQAEMALDSFQRNGFFVFAARLLWRVGDVTRRGGDADLPADGPVRLGHPANATVDEITHWRDRLHDVRQPFKQAYREVYLLTDAERATGTYSNRFAAHVLRYNQAYALFKQRGWVADYLGPYDGGYAGRARREFRDAGLILTISGEVLEHRGASLGELTAIAEVRRDALARILPKLAIAGQLELGDRYVRVQGNGPVTGFTSGRPTCSSSPATAISASSRPPEKHAG